MTTILISDLHLGTHMTVLDHTAAREALFAAIDGADELVLLGDTVDLRYAPVRQVLDRAGPFLAELGRILDGRRVVLVPGNHDHQLAAPILERARIDSGVVPIETVVDAELHGVAGAVADALQGARVSVAYPGLWVRRDVYATHGHYVDCHMTTPRGEVLVASLLQRVAGRIPARATPSDYESVLAPLYSVCYDLAQANGGGERRAQPSKVLQRMKVSGWRVFEGRAGRIDVALVAAAVAVLNRAGLGPFAPDFSPDAVGAAAHAAFEQVVTRLGLDADYVVAGHTHRAGTWALSNGTTLVNTGSWGTSPTPSGRRGPDPYRPGTCVVVTESGVPELRALLDGAPKELAAS
jgi:predicted phosphodiesterase